MRFGIGSKTFFFLIIINCFLNCACGQTEDSKLSIALQHETEAIKLAKNGDFEQAVNEQHKAVALRPLDEKRLAILTRILIDKFDKDKSKDDLTEAKSSIEKAISIKPDDVLLRNTHIVILEKLGDDEGVLKESIEVSKLSPDDLQNLTNLGIAYNAVNKNTLARESFEKALSKNPNYTYTLYQYGEFEVEQSNIEKAKELFDKAVKSSSQSDNSDSKYVELSRKRLEELKDQKTKAMQN